MTALVSFERFSLQRGAQRVLRDVSLQIAPGEKVALVGASGAGKSSLLHEMYRRLPGLAALCPQDAGLVEPLWAYHNIYMAQLERRSFPLNLWNLLFPLSQPWREIGALAEPLGIAPLLRRPVASLSGGERQRVSLARACYRQRPVFLGDEPVSSVDPEQGARLLRFVADTHETMIVALHSPALALGNFDRIVGLSDGAVAFDRAAAALSEEWLADFYRDA